MIRVELQYQLWMCGPTNLFIFLCVSAIVDDDYPILWDRWNIQITLAISFFEVGGHLKRDNQFFSRESVSILSPV